jgi:hypothetical protein
MRCDRTRKKSEASASMVAGGNRKILGVGGRETAQLGLPSSPIDHSSRTYRERGRRRSSSCSGRPAAPCSSSATGEGPPPPPSASSSRPPGCRLLSSRQRPSSPLRLDAQSPRPDPRSSLTPARRAHQVRILFLSPFCEDDDQ